MYNRLAQSSVFQLRYHGRSILTIDGLELIAF